MRDLLTILAVVAGGLALAAAAILVFHDRQTFVPPPEAVVENFARQVAEGRYELAVKYLGRELRATTSAADLRATFDPMRQRIGTPNQVSGEADWVQETGASARARVDGESGNAVLPFRLAPEQGLWRITELPRDLAVVTIARR
jgi:hypothetical protein